MLSCDWAAHIEVVVREELAALWRGEAPMVVVSLFDQFENATIIALLPDRKVDIARIVVFPVMHRLQHVNVITNPIFIDHEALAIHKHHGALVVYHIAQKMKEIAISRAIGGQDAWNGQLLVVETSAGLSGKSVSHSRQCLRESDCPAFIQRIAVHEGLGGKQLRRNQRRAQNERRCARDILLPFSFHRLSAPENL